MTELIKVTIDDREVEVAKGTGAGSLAPTMLISMGIFVAMLLVAYVYAWGKGVFRWD